jgi:hypothetical protein
MVGHPLPHEQHDSGENSDTDHVREAEIVDRAPRSTRLRVILTLALLSWMMLALAIAWVARSL